MDRLDLEAHMKFLRNLLSELRETEPNRKIQIFSSMKIILDLIKEDIEDENGSGNVRCILSEIETNTLSLCGLTPSYSLEPEHHYQNALNSISKLSGGPAYNTIVGENS